MPYENIQSTTNMNPWCLLFSFFTAFMPSFTTYLLTWIFDNSSDPLCSQKWARGGFCMRCTRRGAWLALSDGAFLSRVALFFHRSIFPFPTFLSFPFFFPSSLFFSSLTSHWSLTFPHFLPHFCLFSIYKFNLNLFAFPSIDSVLNSFQLLYHPAPHPNSLRS